MTEIQGADVKINFCHMPKVVRAVEVTIYRKLRTMHCADKRLSHECLGRVTIDRNGITLSCPRCGDARSVYQTAATDDGKGE